MKQFYTTLPRVRMRTNVREPLDPRNIVVPIYESGLHATDQVGELTLSVPRALELIEALTHCVATKMKRHDIADALRRVDPDLTRRHP